MESRQFKVDDDDDDNDTTIVKNEQLLDDEEYGTNNQEARGRDVDNNDDDDDDDDDFYRPPDPSYEKSNSLKFRQLCNRFDTLWKQKSKKKKPTKEEMLDYLLPQNLRKFISTGKDTGIGEGVGNDAQKQESIFPVLRLMCPDKDTTRPNLWMKEAMIGKTWAEAIGIPNKGSDYKKLTNDPTAAGLIATGDISMCVYEVVKKRFPEFDNKKSGGVTVGEMNELFNDLAGIRKKGEEGELSMNITGNARGAQKKRDAWVRKLISKKFSPMEHKWIVRMILEKMDFGVGSDSIINYYHPMAQDIYAANKNLKTLCSTLCDKEYIKNRRRQIQEEINAVDDVNRARHLPRNNQPAALNHTISPMLSMRTSFETILSDLQKRHKAFAELLEKGDPLRSCLALKFPAFTCEVKMDGERLLAHMTKGVVKVQTRRGIWYSQLYSPVIGPFIREAVGSFNVDIIIDGEVVVWDDKEKVTLPFGWNRRVAKVRKDWLKRNGKLDPKDLNLHAGEMDVNVMSDTTFFHSDKDRFEFEKRPNAGSDVWMKYVVFDILYLGGADAKQVMQQAFDFMPEEHRPKITGSILHLDLMKRKRILHTLINHSQDNMIEPVETLVIRTDGTATEGRKYFSSPPEQFEHGYSPLLLDSIVSTLDGVVSNINDIDTKRREGKTDRTIDQQRATALDRLYADIVTKRNLEGLIFKDLASPYCFGAKYRKLAYWYKLKDDYSRSGHAADIDVVVVGASFAGGTRNTKYLNSFLIACADDGSESGQETKYMTVGTCNGNTVGDETLKKLLESTGYKVDDITGEIEYGSWFRSSDNPLFLSRRTFQFSTTATTGGWKPEKKTCPDLWINPEDSFVLTTFSGEIVSTRHFSSGVSLRFPRISAIRKEGFDGDPKAASEIETVSALHDLYYTRRAQQEEAERELQVSQNSQSVLDHQSVFHTVDQHSKNGLTAKKRTIKCNLKVRAPTISETVPFQSDIFKDKNFTVLDGTYRLDVDGLDGQEAKTEGWFDLAKSVRSQQHVVDFILKHGGNCHLTANQETDFIIAGISRDPRVEAFRKSIEGTTADMLLGKAKKGQHLRKIHQIGGLIKWTFLYATVERLHSGSDTSEIVPRRHDFMIISKFAEENLFQNEDDFGLHLLEDANIVDFKRAMMEVKRREAKEWKNKRQKMEPALKVGISGFNGVLSTEEMGILQTPLQKIVMQLHPMLIYPDIFDLECSKDDSTLKSAARTDLNEANKWKDVPPELSFSEIASCLLLVKAVGARTTPYLRREVTHVLCDIKAETVQWKPQLSIDSLFRDAHHGRILHQKLLNLQLSAAGITLVSPDFFRKEWMACE